MTREEFIAELGRRMADGDLHGANRWQVKRMDSRLIGVDTGAGRFVLDIEEIDERPDPLIALLDRHPLPDVPPGLTQAQTMALEVEAGVVDSGDHSPVAREQSIAYDAVYTYIRSLGDWMPADVVHRNAMIWRGVSAYLGRGA